MFQVSRFVKILAFIITVPAVSLSISFFAHAWSEPPYGGGACTTPPCPPNGNAPAPVNISGTRQDKAGAFSVTALYDYNDATNTYFVDPSAGVSAVLNGNVGIGVSPSYKLDINGSVRATNYVWKDNVNWSMPDANSEMSFDFASGDGTAYWHVWDPVHGSILAVRNDGNVGIGTANPGEKLQIAGDLRIGNNNTENSMFFYGVSGDNPGGFNHTVISERLYNGNDQSELLLFKGNDTASCGGCEDRIRIDTPGNILFQTGNGSRSYGSSGTDRMVIKSDGKIGIGTPDPANLLDVKGTLRLTTTADDSKYVTFNAFQGGAVPAETYLAIDPMTSSNNNPSVVRLFRSVNTTGTVALQVFKGDNTTTVNSALSGNGNSYLAAVAGNVGIGTAAAPTEKLEVAGNVKASAFFYSSDERLKENISKIENPLEKILKLNGVTFNWKNDGVKSIGLTAQNVETVFPELVKADNAGMKSVEYGNLVAPLIEAIKEQQKMIENQQKEIDALKALVK